MKTGWTWDRSLYASENSERRRGSTFWKFRTWKGVYVLEIQNVRSGNSERRNDFDRPKEFGRRNDSGEVKRPWAIEMTDSAGSSISSVGRSIDLDPWNVLHRNAVGCRRPDHPTTKRDEMMDLSGPVNTFRTWNVLNRSIIYLDREADHPTTKREFYFLPGSRILRSRLFPVGRPGVGGDRLTLGLFWGS
jgi:hypothetical protein